MTLRQPVEPAIARRPDTAPCTPPIGWSRTMSRSGMPQRAIRDRDRIRRTGDGRMALWVLSGLRIDLDPAFELPDPLPDFDALIVAGGVAPGLDRSIRWLSEALDGRQDGRPVIMVPGNVEYWSDVPLVEALAHGRAVAAELGVTLLSDDAVRMEAPDGSGLFVVGATLWTDWALDGSVAGRAARVAAKHSWPDGDRILLRRDCPLSPLDVIGAHARSRAYVEDALTAIIHQSLGFTCPSKALVEGVRPSDRAMVVTFHAPSRRSLHPDWSGWFRGAWTAASRASDLEGVMRSWGAPVLWVHGDAPTAVDYTIARTRIVANPRVDRDGRTGFDPGLVLRA